MLAPRFDLHRIPSCFTVALLVGGVAFSGVVGCGGNVGGEELPVESGECTNPPCASPNGTTGPGNTPEPEMGPEPAMTPTFGSGDDRAIDGTCYPTCSAASFDSDGDGWGWETGKSCLVSGTPPFNGGTACDAGGPAGSSTSPSPSEPEPAAPPGPPSPASNLDKFVGNITTMNQVRSDFMNHWDQITPENEGKWGSVEYARDQMNWSTVDAIVDFARQNSIPFKQHTFVWGDQSPSWLNGLSEDEQRGEIEEWMRLFCERYPDTQMIDVVNEPDHKTPTFIDAMGGAGTTGHDWVIWSFETARRHCPNAILILNDYNVLRWDTDNFISIANKVRDAGYLDAVADQAHGLEDITLDELQANLQKVVDIGVDVYISEYDLDIADDATQAAVMEEQFTLFHEHPSIVGITLWGYVYGATWREHTGLVRNGQPRPAMTWLMDYLGR